MSARSTDDAARISRALGAWLAPIVDAPEVRVEQLVKPEGSGLSAQTFLFDAVWEVDGSDHREPLVARVAPEGPGLFPTYDLEAEAKVIRALAAHTDVPVADIIGVEGDREVIGAPFMVMRRTPGRVPLDDPPWPISGWVVDLPVEGRTKIFDEFLKQLVAIHATDWKALGLGFLDRPEDGATPLDQHLTYLDRYYDFASDGARDSELITQGLDWIRAHRPTDDEPTVLSWGDSQPHNMIYADDLSAAAALDWEMVSLASHEMDLACLTFCMDIYTEGMGNPLLEGFPDRGTMVSMYEAAGGYPVRNFEYYETFNAVRSAMILMRLGRLLIAAGVLPKDSTMPMVNPSSKVLARMLGVSAPDPSARGSFW